MNRIKCATFDKDMQDSIPKEIRDKMKADRAKAEKEQETKSKTLPIQCVVGSVYRPKNGHELLLFLKENKKCEVVDGVSFDAAKALEDNKCGFSFSFKKSNWHKGWASFERC